jgi:transposase, IS30 family
MKYHQITSEERYMMSRLRVQGFSQAAIGRWMQRHPSTIGRELKRNGTTHDGRYRVEKAIMKANGRRSRSRRNQRFTSADMQRVEFLLSQLWSPEQICGHLRKTGLLRISHETIYRHIWHDRRYGGDLYRYLRGARKLRRKRYQHHDSRGRLAGKRHISERPLAAEQRACVGHWEIDTVIGHASKHCIVSLVDRKTGFVQIGKLHARTAAQTTQRTIDLINRQPAAFQTITADNGTEFHSYAQIERATGVRFYFATPHHSWERGTNENTNGLIRQYLPKKFNMANITQHQCNVIANKLNARPRKRFDYQTPAECFYGN